MADITKDDDFFEADPENKGKGKPRVFVYGSLKRGHGNHVLLHQSRLIGMDEIDVPAKFVCLGGFPGVVKVDKRYDWPSIKPGDELTRVKGELYEVDNDTLTALDFLEGHPSFYARSQIVTARGIKCWVYALPAGEHYANNAPVEAGLWRPTDGESAFWEAISESAA